MDLVTREEFDIQQGVLARSRAKLEALEKQVAEMEQHLQRDEGRGTRDE
jgi:BMFP domain-containing protein YqiC